MRRFSITFFISVVALVGCLSSTQAAEGTVEFNRDIRQLLSDTCFQCHGPDKNTREAGLRLDTVEGAHADLGGYQAIVPGDPAKSEMFQRITASNADDRMPPENFKRQLTAEEIELLRRWIEQGGKYESHWAYLPPTKAPLPEVKQADWPENPIDFFILERIENAGLAPSQRADRRTLIRRLSFDLIGLPPTPLEVEAFVNDADPNAYEKLVDRMLRSPKYGERMAMHWLDLVRYADTVGYHGDQDFSVWPFRDYVINAFNDNLPYDQFTREQLAGDLMPEATRDQLVASGYNRLNMITAEGGAQDKEYLAKYAADRVRTTSTTWLGATMGCSECHDHKFDPYTMKDFYSMEAFFADLDERGLYSGANRDGRWGPMMQLPSEEDTARLNEFDTTIARLENELITATPELEQAQAEWEQRLRDLHGNLEMAWQPLKPLEAKAKNGSKLNRLQNYSIRAEGDDVETDTFTITFETDRQRITGLRLEALPSQRGDAKKMGMNGSNIVLSEFEVEAQTGDGKKAKVKIGSATADYSQKDFEVANAIDGKDKTGWAIDGHKETKRRVAAFAFDKPLAGGPGTKLTVHLRQESDVKKHLMGRFRISISSVDEPTFENLGMPKERWQLVRKPADQRSTEEATQLASYFREMTPLLDPTRNELAKQKRDREKYDEAIPTTLVSRVRAEPRTIRVLPRGNWLDDSGEIVNPNVPEFLASGSKSDKERQDRLDLANWLVSEENPLTARVFVNRLWKLYFGTGLSKVLDDLGSQGEWPTHPELLDWLAVDFMENGWDIKYAIKQIVSSAAYQQTSTSTTELNERDPFNRLLARQGSFRLPAETVRDTALQISGLLVDDIGGPSAKPYQPAGYYEQLNFPKREYQADSGQNQYRRGVYTHWQRTFLHPMLKAFDAPSREECTAERPRSNTPLQALALLNDPSFVEAARVFAERIVREGGSTAESRLDWAYQWVLARSPKPAEQKLVLGLYENHLAKYQKETEDLERCYR